MIKRLLLILLVLFTAASVQPQSSRMNNLKRKQQEAQRKVADTDKRLKEASRSAKKSLNDLNLITAEITVQRKEIGKLNQDIAKIQREERELLRKIDLLEVSLKGKKSDYAKSMQSISRKNSGYDILIFLFSANSFSQTVRRVRYLKEFSSWRKRQAEEIIEQQNLVDQKIKSLSILRAKKDKVLVTRSQEAALLKDKENKQRIVVSKLKKNEKALQSELKKQKKQAAELNRQIEKLIADEARNSNRIKSSTSSKPQTSSGYSMTKEEQVLANNFASNKGKLPMPLSGRYIIVGHFGKQQHQELQYVQVNNSGIIIKTTPGTEARSVFDGVVTKIFVVPGYNSSVIVRHGNYLTIYSNLSSVYVKAGSKVSTRQSLGRIYSDPESDNETLLHFQLWRETVKQNPESWLDN